MKEIERTLDMLRLMLGRRNLDTTTTMVQTDDLIKVDLYTIGDRLIIFSQKDNVQKTDINKFIEFAGANGYTNGITIVGLSPPSENILRLIKSLASQNIQCFHIRQLQFDITTHRLATPHRILKADEIDEVVRKYKITDPKNQFPWIDSQDAMAKWIGAVPGDIVEIKRHSETVGSSLFYRYCIEDATA